MQPESETERETGRERIQKEGERENDSIHTNTGHPNLSAHTHARAPTYQHSDAVQSQWSGCTARLQTVILDLFWRRSGQIKLIKFSSTSTNCLALLEWFSLYSLFHSGFSSQSCAHAPTNTHTRTHSQERQTVLCVSERKVPYFGPRHDWEVSLLTCSESHSSGHSSPNYTNPVAVCLKDIPLTFRVRAFIYQEK